MTNNTLWLQIYMEFPNGDFEAIEATPEEALKIGVDAAARRGACLVILKPLGAANEL